MPCCSRPQAPAPAPALSRDAARAAAAERCTQPLQLPLVLGDSLQIESFGSLEGRPGYCTADRLFPAGFRAVWTDPVVGAFSSEIQEAGERPAFAVCLLTKDAADDEVPVLLATGDSLEGAWEAVAQLQKRCAEAAGDAVKPPARAKPARCRIQA